MSDFACLAAAVVIVLASAPDAAHACSCTEADTPTAELSYAHAVFRGTVTKIEDSSGCGGHTSADVTVVRLDVSTSWKGDVGRSTEVLTARSGAACGFGFVKGQEYLVYAREDEGGLSVGLCSRTRRVSEASEDLSALGAGTTVSAITRSIQRVTFANMGLLPLLAALAFLRLSTRRR